MSLIPYLRNNDFIPRQDYSARHRNAVKDGGSVFENKTTSVTFTSFTVFNCTIQPLKGNELLTLDEGLRGKETYTLRTDTAVTSAVEGTDQLADQIQYEGVNGLEWFDVIKVRKHNVGVIPHYEAIIVRQPNQ